MIKFTPEQETILKANFEKHGEAFMRDKLVEELSELLCELCKHKTKGNRITQISEEFADVCVVLKQFGIEIPSKSNTLCNVNGLIDLVSIYLNGVIKKRPFQINRMRHFFSSLLHIDFDYVQSTIDAKIIKMEGKQNQSLPYEVNH